jgi:hypothetical protein
MNPDEGTTEPGHEASQAPIEIDLQTNAASRVAAVVRLTGEHDIATVSAVEQALGAISGNMRRPLELRVHGLVDHRNADGRSCVSRRSGRQSANRSSASSVRDAVDAAGLRWLDLEQNASSAPANRAGPRVRG